MIKERDIAMDFATKVYEKFGKIIKSVILFGSTAKGTAEKHSDIDVIIIVDDATVQWDTELIGWYREELGKLIMANPYTRSLHINTVKLTTWWHDMIRGDPVIMNIIRWGEALIDFAGFFNPLKVLLVRGNIKSTPESIYMALQRAPIHMARSKAALLGAIEGLYWAMVDSSHAALIAAKKSPPSPEHVPILLRETFVDKGLLDMKYVTWYRDLYLIAHRILHGDITAIKGNEIDLWIKRTDEFIKEMAIIVNRIV
ncbi:hypothetical protein COS75_02595 [Candidatus Pacearchaeota archaeon CG06_land_8_20_14_3_00_35_12]|nr:MAG: hypothetical protein COS75_02595 [Candidatus Pacearchaeota archaeon CG06_land_8_20_14_3_00_35_12]